MAGRRFNKTERTQVTKSRKQFQQEQRIRDEVFNAAAQFDPQFGNIAVKLSK